MNIVVYDCEIKRGIPKRGEEKLPDVEYCDGWRDFAGMGVSVTGVYDYAEDRYRVFCDDNVEEMLTLFANTDLMVSFNGIGFDDPLLTEAYLSYDFESIETPRYDLLVEIWRAAGLKPSWGSSTTHGGYGLDAMCETNFDVRKTGHGADAPVQWQRGEIGRVIDYCLNDVRMTKMLFDAVIVNHPLVNPKGGLLYLINPEDTFEIEDVLQMKNEEQSESPDLMPTGGPVLGQTSVVSNEDVVTEVESVLVKEDTHSVTANKIHWDDLMVEYERLGIEDRVMIAVHDSDGLVVKRKLKMDEWSDGVCPLIKAKDGEGLVAYLRKTGDDSG